MFIVFMIGILFFSYGGDALWVIKKKFMDHESNGFKLFHKTISYRVKLWYTAKNWEYLLWIIY